MTPSFAILLHRLMQFVFQKSSKHLSPYTVGYFVVFFRVFRVLTALSIYEFLWLRWNGLPLTCSTCEPPARTGGMVFPQHVPLVNHQQEQVPYAMSLV
ncbi:hypothetical protein P8452_09995 [Trifolium repens]|nr:hypothetical protein P8452_09995 [Trifolium repens]